jgi:hypothetical protein
MHHLEGRDADRADIERLFPRQLQKAQVIAARDARGARKQRFRRRLEACSYALGADNRQRRGALGHVLGMDQPPH